MVVSQPADTPASWPGLGESTGQSLFPVISMDGYTQVLGACGLAVLEHSNKKIRAFYFLHSVTTVAVIHNSLNGWYVS